MTVMIGIYLKTLNIQQQTGLHIIFLRRHNKLEFGMNIYYSRRAVLGRLGARSRRFFLNVFVLVGFQNCCILSAREPRSWENGRKIGTKKHSKIQNSVTFTYYFDYNLSVIDYYSNAND